MQINSHYPRARADCRQKSDTPPVRPQSHDLHLDGLRASPDPLLGVLASQYLERLQTPPRGRRQRTSGNETASEKNQQLADARALRLTPQSTAPKHLPTESVRDNASSEAEGVKGSTFFNILRTSTMPDFSTSRRGIRLILSMEGRSSARSSLGVHPLPARSNGLRNALGPYHFLAFPGPHNQPQPLGPHAVREVSERLSRARGHGSEGSHLKCNPLKNVSRARSVWESREKAPPSNPCRRKAAAPFDRHKAPCSGS